MKPKNQKKISVLVAFRIMQEVYSPLMKRYKELLNNDALNLCGVFHKFCLVGHDKLLDNDIEYFDYVQMTATINNVAKNIVKLHLKYYKDFGMNFNLAVASVLTSCYREMMKLNTDKVILVEDRNNV